MLGCSQIERGGGEGGGRKKKKFALAKPLEQFAIALRQQADIGTALRIAAIPGSGVEEKSRANLSAAWPVPFLENALVHNVHPTRQKFTTLLRLRQGRGERTFSTISAS